MEKKISFGFSKLVKKPQLIVNVPKVEEKLELIEGFEGDAAQVIGKVDDGLPVAPLVIPLTSNTTPLEKVKQLREENRPQKKAPLKEESASNGVDPDETLEQRAAREIIENLKVSEDAEDAAAAFTVPLTADEVKLGGAKTSSMDDYENVPIAQFGLAMLRGMGWKDAEHKAKQKSLEDDIIVCRPKGLGLGADKAMKQQVKLATNNSDSNEKLVMKKGAFVRILGGKHKDFYGQVEGMDEESGRVFIKLALGGRKESVNEAFVHLVPEKEYKENRKVLNVTKYEEYKSKEGQSSSSSSRRADTTVVDERIKEPKRDKHSENGSKDYSDRRNEYGEEKTSESGRHKKDRRRDRSRSRSQDRWNDSSSSKYSSHRKSDRREHDREDDHEDDRRSHRDRRRDRSRSREGSSRRYDDSRRDRHRDEGQSSKSHRDNNGKRRDR